MSFESAAAAERRPLSVTERAETRRHGEGTARSRRSNQSQIKGSSSIDVSESINVTTDPSDVFFLTRRGTRLACISFGAVNAQLKRIYR